MLQRLPALMALSAVLAAAMPAMAARPFMTDDARLTTEGSCQVESWARHYKDRNEFWALPACNPGGHFEITAGAGRFRSDGLPGSADQVLQGKTLFRTLQTNDWAWGLAVGRVWHPSAQPGPNNLGGTYLYLPFTLSTRDDQVVFHAKLGWTRDRHTRLNATTWGGGVEYWVHPRLMLIAESFGDDRQKPFVQSGLRFSVIPGLFQVDATRGTQPGSQGRNTWTSIGIRYTPDKLF
ncbi:MAG: hypothetical protein ACKOBF_07315 [Limnohabitans sp.]